jgi:hypothetical protein
MNSTSSNSRAEAVALARFSLISKVRELLAQHVPLKIALETVASSSAVAGSDGSSQAVAVRTLEDWWYAHERGGFAALHPQGRSDRGVPRKLTPELALLSKANPGFKNFRPSGLPNC